MKQLPIFVNLAGKNIVMLGEGEAADAKRRLIERAGGICVDDSGDEALLAFVAIENEAEAIQAADMLRKRGLLVNVVDRPEHCDFTTPAIVDRDPVLIAVGTSGASAGLAKAIRQRLEALLPQSLGRLAQALLGARGDVKKRWPDSNDRRRAIDAALATGGLLDPFAEHEAGNVAHWTDAEEAAVSRGLQTIEIANNDPEELTLRAARLLGEADHIFHGSGVSPEILNRARADAERHSGPPPKEIPSGLILYLRLQGSA